MRNISDVGVKLIKSFEGCSLNSYKCVPTEEFYTIGWGHYGKDIKENMVITQAQADSLFMQDIQRYVAYVNAVPQDLSQNQFDALCSFAYNCGNGSLQKLCKGRSKAEISEHMMLYNTSGGAVLKGLTARRQKEKDIFTREGLDLTVMDANEIIKYLTDSWAAAKSKEEREHIHALANAVRIASGQVPQK